MRRLTLIALAALSAAGCRPRTEILLGVATDLRAPSALDNVHIDILRDGVPVEQQDWPIPGTRTGLFILPGSFGVFSSDGSTPRVEVIVTGTKGALGTEIVRRRALFTLVGEKTLFMRMGLVAGCMNNLDCGKNEDLTCIEGVCKPVIVDTKILPKFQPDLIDHVTCNSGTTFVNTGTMEALPPLGDMTCGGPCVEGTCYVPPDGTLQPLWGTQELPPSAGMPTLHAVWSYNGHTFTAGNGVILHLAPGAGPMAASSWIDESSATGGAEQLALFGSSDNDVWAVGDAVLHRVNGTWTKLADSPALAALGAYEMHAGISFGPSSALMVGRDAMGKGVLLSWNGTQWVVDNTGSMLAGLMPGDLKAIAGAAPNQLVVVGNGGFIATFNNNVWKRPFTDGNTTDWKGVWMAPNGEGWVVGAGGQILRGRMGSSGGATPLEPSGTDADLVAVWGTSLTNAFAVGGNGTILHSRGDGVWSPQPSGVNVQLYGISGQGATSIYAVGEAGTILLNSNGQVVGGGGPASDGGTMPVDAAPMSGDGGTLPCSVLNCVPVGGGCGCDQTCNGSRRTMDCTIEGICTCAVDGKQSNMFFGTQPCQNTMQSFNMCGFPPN